MKDYFVDLHVHIGRDWEGGPVKITGSKTLTLTNIFLEASRRKGLDLIGIIDAQSPAVLDEVEDLIDRGYAEEVSGGGVRSDSTTLLLGSEVEIYDASCQGPIHVLCYFPTIDTMRRFSLWLSKKMKNVSLSSQRFYGTARELQTYVRENGGLFIPAHIFTPFKSLYGKGVKKSLREILDSDKIDAVELGLSADTEMASQLAELAPYTYVTNSDAHSLGKLAREYQLVRMDGLSLEELKLALHRKDGRRIVANYGMDPKMGKYHKTVCGNCLHPVTATGCTCRKSRLVKGVSERIKELSDEGQVTKRPPYVYQVPLETLPGIGKQTYEKLLAAFGSEMAVIHDVPSVELEEIVSSSIVHYIIQMRKGELDIAAGGGGKFGKIH
ncbi:TIGR00375 family protein [Bacillus sp. SB49]|uniref:endonuclease Q family protein n=1 Tax=Bacillus sp. SB49 TaxID=1071080 RepID=UPI0004005203|nr:endonuclease Q family protein [Bacillus sp. SB49]QHT46939.1 TIGR00375 family protein [Bacillus sp. SB49]